MTYSESWQGLEARCGTKCHTWTIRRVTSGRVTAGRWVRHWIEGQQAGGHVRTDKLRTILGPTLAADAKRSGVKQERTAAIPRGGKDAAERQEHPTPDADSDAPPSDN